MIATRALPKSKALAHSEYNLRQNPPVAVPDFPTPAPAMSQRHDPRPVEAVRSADTWTVAAIRDALGEEPQSRSLTSPELERAVRAFALGARAMGTPPERMLTALVTIVASNTPSDASDWWRAVLRDRIVVWAIEGYYNIDIQP